MRGERGIEDRPETLVVYPREIWQAERPFPMGERVAVEVDGICHGEMFRIVTGGYDVGVPLVRRNPTAS